MDNVLAELWEERAGILNWLVAGALEYLNAGGLTSHDYRFSVAPMMDWRETSSFSSG
ncbi:hypothetical protein ACFQZO_00320 [Bradyrhizobium sp. GCM10027634]|uniref:hypothetical protein n=1 Tax=unclassified Bradyrhizobium TaxID=2631580 RepID=UPI00188A958E|nr:MULTISPECIES: hypothetical protein [unclassified Bradyrhizobium]MDN4999321.1 hypothetical protein [Bradyrhizobium sp. WYCCWR 12677]